MRISDWSSDVCSSVLECAQAVWSPRPFVLTRRTILVEPAHGSHRVGFLVVLDEGEDLFFRAEVNAMGFFKRSCSSLSRSYLRCTSRSSLSSAATALSTSTLLVTIKPSRASLRQRDRTKGWM